MPAQRPLSADSYEFLYLHVDLLLIVCQYIFIVTRISFSGPGPKQRSRNKKDRFLGQVLIWDKKPGKHAAL